MNIEKKVVLIVEDEISYLRTLKTKLELEGFVILSAQDGVEGLQTAIKKHPDLIILDIKMPKMDGIEMAKKLRQDPWGKNAKIIILTNLPDTEKVQMAMENEVYEYLIKTDIKIQDLMDKVRAVLV